MTNLTQEHCRWWEHHDIILFKLQHNFAVLGAAAKYDVLKLMYLNNKCRERTKDNDELSSRDGFFSWLVIDGLCRVKSESRSLSHPLCDQCKHTDWLFPLTSSSSFGCLSGIYGWCVPSRPRHNALTDGVCSCLSSNDLTIWISVIFKYCFRCLANCDSDEVVEEI